MNSFYRLYKFNLAIEGAPRDIGIAKVDCKEKGEIKWAITKSHCGMKNERNLRHVWGLHLFFHQTPSLSQFKARQKILSRCNENEAKGNWWNQRLWVDYSPTGLNQGKPRDFCSVFTDDLSARLAIPS